MRNITRSAFGLLLILSLVCCFPSVGSGAEPGWTNRVLKRGTDREQTNATHILQRPYRPLHFYGNSVRRKHYRGVARPSVLDVGRTVVHLVAR